MSRPLTTDAIESLYCADPVEWAVFAARVPYEPAVAAMEARAAAVRDGAARETVWLLEHPPLYTAGTGAKITDLKDPDRFPTFKAARGGQYTYHGPGQRVAYVMLDLAKRGKDIRNFVFGLEAWIIETLTEFGLTGERRADRVGVWIDRTRPGAAAREDKIAAIGVRIRKWVSFHGIAINVEPDLSHFDGIVPCGVAEDGFGVTSLVDQGITATLNDVDHALKIAFEKVFAPTMNAPPPRIG